MDFSFSWGILVFYVLFLLALDIGVLHRKQGHVSVKRALYETLFFVGNALLFTGAIYWFYKTGLTENPTNLKPIQAVTTYLTGYVIELSLSVDNLFVIALIFTSFNIPDKYQHRLLFLGILGAIVFRALLIGVGLFLITKFEIMPILFGLFLLFTAFKMLKKEPEKASDEPKPPKILSRIFPFSKIMDGGKYVTKIEGRTVFTALAGALITIELTDLLFALDSIPAIFAVTTDPFIVYSSNIFAIMGLRSLYFFLANMLEKFRYLKYSVFAILVFVSLKLMTVYWIEIPEWFSILFIVLALVVGIIVSLKRSSKDRGHDIEIE